MSEQEILQIKNILHNIQEAKKLIPYLRDLQMHPAFWPFFSGLSQEQEHQINQLIDDYIFEQLVLIKKTKGGQLFNRFAESQSELFWTFRRLNAPDSSSPEFQIVWKQVEIEMFKLEGILTEKMLKQEKGLEKVVESFYNLVYLFFPRFNEIE